MAEEASSKFGSYEVGHNGGKEVGHNGGKEVRLGREASDNF